MLTVCVLIPAYNEGQNIREIVVATSEYVDELIVCDDGSTDDTCDILSGLDVLQLSHSVNMGYGAALKSLFGKCSELGFDYAVTIDGDGQHDPRFIPSLLEPLEKGVADVVIGSRFLNDSDVSWVRRRGISVINSLIERGVGLSLSDSQSGFRAYRVSKLCDLSLSDHGMGVSTEILIRAAEAGLRIVEVPVMIKYHEHAGLVNLTRHGVCVLSSTIRHLL